MWIPKEKNRKIKEKINQITRRLKIINEKNLQYSKWYFEKRKIVFKSKNVSICLSSKISQKEG